MSGPVPLARRDFLRQRLRLALSVAGVGLALLLVLALQAIYGGVLRQVTVYPDNQGAPVIVSQRGVTTMHMATSAIPGSVIERLKSDPRIERADPILYVSIVLGRSKPDVAYLIGYRGAGGPWEMSGGREPTGPGEIVIDERTADRLGARLGDRVQALGHDLQVVGLASGTASVVSSVAFVDLETFRRAASAGDSASYVLVWPAGDTDAATAAQEIEGDYPVTAQTKEEFSDSEQAVVSDMSTGLIRGMLVIGFVVGVAVAALSLYTATTARLRQYAVLKAIGMPNRTLYGVVSRQAALTVGGGLAVALLLLGLLMLVIPLAEPSVTFALTGDALIRVVAITAAIAVVAALLPTRRLARVDPATVYRE